MPGKHIGLFFGSFNPVHVGHLIIANYVVGHSALDEVWMVVSPHNPLKDKRSLANDYDRLHLVKLAIDDTPKLRASDIEFVLPKPSYTIDTLTHLSEKYPQHQFALIMGGDNLGSFHKWKNYQLILDNHQIFVYSRPGYALGDLAEHEHVAIMEAPLLQVSSSYIRAEIQQGRSVRYLVPDVVYRQLEASGLYR